MLWCFNSMFSLKMFYLKKLKNSNNKTWRAVVKRVHSLGALEVNQVGHSYKSLRSWADSPNQWWVVLECRVKGKVCSQVVSWVNLEHFCWRSCEWGERPCRQSCVSQQASAVFSGCGGYNIHSDLMYKVKKGKKKKITWRAMNVTSLSHMYIFLPSRSCTDTNEILLTLALPCLWLQLLSC